MENAELIRKLRIEHHLSQQELANGITTRTTLSSFEVRKTELSLEHAINYLNRLNVTLSEYEFLLQNTVEREKHQYLRYLKRVDEAQARVYTQILRDKYQQTNDQYFYYLYAQRELLNYRWFSQIFTTDFEDLVSHIKTYLNRIETWGHFEIVLFLNTMTIFDSEYIIQVIKNVLPLTEQYQETIYFSQIIAALVQNGIGLGIKRGDLELIDVFKRELYRIADTDESCTTFLLTKFFRAVDQLTLHHDDTLFAAEMLACTQLANLLKLQDWLTLLQDYLYLTR